MFHKGKWFNKFETLINKIKKFVPNLEQDINTGFFM